MKVSIVSIDAKKSDGAIALWLKGVEILVKEHRNRLFYAVFKAKMCGTTPTQYAVPCTRLIVQYVLKIRHVKLK